MLHTGDDIKLSFFHMEIDENGIAVVYEMIKCEYIIVDFLKCRKKQQFNDE